VLSSSLPCLCLTLHKACRAISSFITCLENLWFLRVLGSIGQKGSWPLRNTEVVRVYHTSHIITLESHFIDKDPWLVSQPMTEHGRSQTSKPTVNLILQSRLCHAFPFWARIKPAKIMLGICGRRNPKETTCPPYWIDFLPWVRENCDNCFSTIPHIYAIGKRIHLPLVGISHFMQTPQHLPYLAYSVQFYTPLEYANTFICLLLCFAQSRKPPGRQEVCVTVADQISDTD